MFSPRKILPAVASLVAFGLCLNFLPAAWCKRDSHSWFVGELSTEQRLVRTVVRQTTGDLGLADFSTGSALFNGEWLFGTYLMAGIGLCQVVAEHPESKAESLPAIEHCIRELLTERVAAFDTTAWHQSALRSLSSDRGHAAYLGYLNFLLGLYRQIAPENEFVPLNDRITAALFRRLRQSRNGLIETYPGEWYPMDNAPLLASIYLQARATGRDTTPVEAFVKNVYGSRYLDSATNLLIQAVDEQGNAIDEPRASGSTLAVFFLARAFPDFSRDLFHGIQDRLATRLFNFGAVREFPPTGARSHGDIDSGPVILGYSFSGTGFALAGARAYGDETLFSSLYASAVLAGAPTSAHGDLDFLTGGPLGNAILLAVLTTPRQP